MDTDVEMTEPGPSDWFLGHTVSSIVTIVAGHVRLTATQKRTKKSLYAVVSTLGQELQGKIREEAWAADGKSRKQKRAVETDTRAVKLKRVPSVPEEEAAEPLSLLEGPFLTAATDETVQGCIERYIDGTSNDALLKHICLICARRLFAKKMEEILIEEIPNKRHLIPCYSHPAHRLTDIYLFHEDVKDDAVTFICHDCIAALRRNERPRLSLANSMWIGAIPTELEILTLPERLLIALYFPAVYVVKLFPKGKNKYNWDQATVNSGMRGNVSTYRLHRADIAAVMSGRAMPPAPAILSATIAVSFVGAKNLPLRILPDMFKVRRRRVREALAWLQKWNPIYRDIEISEERLRALPENSVPEEILETTRYEESSRALDREREGYVPVYQEDEPMPLITHASLGVDGNILPVVEANDEGRHDDYDPAVIPLQANGVVDAQGEGIPDSDIMAHALANTTNAARTDSFAIRKGSAFINDYPRVDEDGQRTDGGPSDPNHMLGAFPVLFPYGKGGFETEREQEVSYEAHVRWALNYADARFRKDLFFIFQAFGVIQKRQICRSAGLQIKRSAFIHNQAAFLRLTPTDLQKASGEETRRVAFTNPIIQSLRRQITAIRARVQGTDESRQSIRSQVWGMNII